MNLFVLEAARRCRTAKVVMALSSGMYPSAAPLPLKETCLHDGPPHASNYSYAFAKRLVEPCVRAYRAEFGMNVVGLVPNGIFGEHDNFDPETGTFIAALIRRFYDGRHADAPLVVWGDGAPRREVTYARDIARAFMWAVLHYDAPEILNIGTTEEHSIREIAGLIADVLGIDRRRLVFDPSRPSGIFRKSTDNSRFLALSGFRYTPFAEGLRNTIAWLAQNEAARATAGG